MTRLGTIAARFAVCALWVWALLLLGQAQGQPTGLAGDVMAEVRMAEELPAGHYVEVHAWEAEAESVGHRTGREIPDERASNRKAFGCEEGIDEDGTLLFGPYIEVEPAVYVALFRMRLGNIKKVEDDDVVARVDACVDYARTILAETEVWAEDLTAERYTLIPLAFVYRGGKLECRVHWTGFGTLLVDGVRLYRVQGATERDVVRMVAQPQPSGEPHDLVYVLQPRPFPDIFPRSSRPASSLVACDLRRRRPDEQLMVLALQGLVNRQQPRIWCFFNDTDEFWLKELQGRGLLGEIQEVEQPLALVARFRQFARGLVITDAKLPATRNIATMMAGVQDLLPVSSRLAKDVDLPVVADLRGRWRTSAEAYRWAFDELWVSLNHHVAACSWPDHLGLRDYLVQHRIPIFWLPGRLDGARVYSQPELEVRQVEQLLARMPANIPIMSYPWAGRDVGIGEGPGVTLFAEFGKYLVGSINCSNLSVHSGIQVSDPRQRPSPPVPELKEDKVYISWIISDGDNLPVLTIGNFPALWRQEPRGRLPIGWTLSPAAVVLVPGIVDYYYRTATDQDYFLGAVSGVGYTYADAYGRRFRDEDKGRVLDEFLEQTRKYMERSDLRCLWIMGASREEVIGRYAERIPFLEALFPDYGRRMVRPEDLTYPTVRNVPVFHAATVWREDDSREDRIRLVVDDLRRMVPAGRPAFVHAFVLNWFADLPMLEEIQSRLGPEYVAVRPDHLAALYRRYLAREQVLVQLPTVLWAIEGRKHVIEAKVHNATDKEMAVQARLTDGGGQVRPERMVLAAATKQRLTITEAPHGEHLVLEVSGPFGKRSVRASRHTVAADAIVGDILPNVMLRFAASYEAEALAHHSGREELDPAASGGKTWVAEKGQARPGHIVFGPYAPLEKGKYLALFCLKRLGDGGGTVAELDTCVGGGSPQTGVVTVASEQLPVGEYRWVPIVFEHPGGAVETRVNWSGAASLAVDCVVVWGISDGR